MNAYRGWLFYGLCFVLIGCMGGVSTSSAQDSELNPGNVYGTIRFIDTSSAVAAHLAENQVTLPQEISPQLYPVRLYRANNNTVANTGMYIIINSSPDSSTYNAAYYILHPHVEDAGSDFRVVIDPLLFEDASTYRFGSSSTASIDIHQCLGVLPATQQPDGTMCDVHECAALLDLQYKFVPDPDEPDILDALDENVEVKCHVSAYLEDPPGSNTTGLQAKTGELVNTVDEMTSEGAQAQLLVRASAAPVFLSVYCNAKVKDNETGFVIIPASEPAQERTPFSSPLISLGPLDCGVTQNPSIIEIPVRRDAGRLVGYFDVSDHSEDAAQISLDAAGSDFSLDPPLVPAGALPTEQWEFKGAPQGNHKVIVRAVLDDGDKWLMLPHRDGQNSQVTVIQGQTTDINATFVTKPVLAQGNVLLFDPTGATDLHALDNSPFSTSAYTTNSYSYIEAVGIPELPWPNGGSGIGGYSRARLNGAYDPANNEAHLNYELLLVGLSPENGNLDGTDAKATLWHVDKIHVNFDPEPGGHNYADIELGQWIDQTADLGSSGNAISLQEHNICFSRAELVLRVDESLGTFFEPKMSINTSGLYSPAVIGVSELMEVNGQAFGEPISASDSASVVSVAATIPEGFQYNMIPKVRYIPAGSAENDLGELLTLPPVLNPVQGVKVCGQSTLDCATYSEEGTFSVLSVSITDENGVENPDYCLHDNDLELNIGAHSDGVNVQRLAYVIDPPSSITTTNDLIEYCNTNDAAAVLCSDCGPDPQFPVTLTALTPGEHILVACAIDSYGCESLSQDPFSVVQQNLAWQHAPDFTAELEIGETGIPKEDPRIADNLWAYLEGNCGVPTTINDDRPDIFPIGETIVTFSANGIDDCDITVTVVEPVLHDLAFVERESNATHVLKVYTVEQESQITVDWFDAADPHEVWVEYDRMGQVLGYAYSGGTNQVKSFDAISAAQIYPPYSCPGNCVNLAYRPEHEGQYAVVDTPDSNTYTIKLVKDGAELDTQSVPAVPGMSSIELAWSPLGNKLSAVFTAPQAGNPTAGEIHYYQWTIIGDTFGAQTSANSQRDFREYVHELLHLADDSVLFGTNYTINTVEGNTITPLGTMPSASGEEGISMGALDFTDSGNAAGIISRFFASPQSPDTPTGFLWGMINIGQPDVSDVEGEIILNFTTNVAMSSDMKYIAVGVIDAIYVFSFPDFSWGAAIAANQPYDLAFRPVGPYSEIGASKKKKQFQRIPLEEIKPQKWQKRKLLPDSKLKKVKPSPHRKPVPINKHKKSE